MLMKSTSFCTKWALRLVRNVGKFPMRFDGTKCMLATAGHLGRGWRCWHGRRLKAVRYEYRQCGRFLHLWLLPVVAAGVCPRPLSANGNRRFERPRDVGPSDGPGATWRRLWISRAPRSLAALCVVAGLPPGAQAGVD